tara:strand:+ start:404 stop:1441 length:1038 start_codon:yes stop_codon:yes gene_type:complete
VKFQLAINLERVDDTISMQDVARHTLEMVQLADRNNFNIVWAAEHHALEMTIAPNPFQILTWWASHTNNIRLGTGVVAAPYWHPIRLAGEAAFTDLITGGRLEFGIGSGAYQREFDRMRPGLKQTDGWRYMQELLPAVKELWKGDYEHEGDFWQFPTSTSVPKPIQTPHPPIWVAARSPITYDYALKNDCNVMCWPFTRPHSEAELYKRLFEEAIEKAPGSRRPTFALMRHTAVYANEEDKDVPIKAIQRVLGQFENLYKNLGDVSNGFPKEIPLESLTNRAEFDSEMLQENLMFGIPETIISKIKRYEAMGVDEFIYYASMGLGLKEQKKSLELFCSEVMPAFK